MPKKTFMDNPAMQFISTPEEEPQEAKAAEKAPEGYKVNPIYVETRSRRLQLIVQPSLYEKVKAQAKAAGQSVNDYIHQLLEEATKGE